MRVCLLGDTTGLLDEGMKNSTHYLYRVLEEKCDVLLVRPSQALLPLRIADIVRFQPQIVHYTMGPTWRSFAVVKALSIILPNCRFVMSSPRPHISEFQLRTFIRFRPSLMLTQSRRQESWFQRFGFKTKFFPPGVDIARFVPVSSERKKTLRGKYQLESEKPIVLHIGQVSPERELEKLIPIQQTGQFQVVILAASTIPPDSLIVRNLELAGCIVRKQHVQPIEEIYQLADFFVFPGAGTNAAIEIPLTVLEAMACNLPVITAAFGGLPDVFPEGEGLCYANTSEEIVRCLQSMITEADKSVDTRKTVARFSWGALAGELVQIYDEVYEGRS